MLWWFGHLERMNEGRLTKQIYRANVRDGKETVCDGWSAVKTLCNLPANWIVSPPQNHALLPTLAALADHPSARDTIAGELNMQMIEDYIESREAQDNKLVQLIRQGRAKKLQQQK
ncbi:hypothetical protein EVAR_101773_1 [Eumeta japonica]|uniref:Uncharacterized protein n=1 Tax=Eumeta variegata TaxID=151549 RepID=A0A4C1SMF6_EUMVA|nr:hypothetical protein EVAR_101773_1 [Eumeta japonica]